MNEQEQLSYDYLNRQQHKEYLVAIIWLAVAVFFAFFNETRGTLENTIIIVSIILSIFKYMKFLANERAKLIIGTPPKNNKNFFQFILSDGKILSVFKDKYYFDSNPISEGEFIKYLYSWAEMVEKNTLGFKLQLKISKDIIGEFNPDSIIFNGNLLADKEAAHKIWSAMTIMK